MTHGLHQRTDMSTDVSTVATIDACYVQREPPTGPIEEALAHIWSGLLGIETISRHDNFFELGGDSLLTVQMVEQLRLRGLSTHVPIFAAPVLRELALTIEGSSSIKAPPNLIRIDS